MSKTSTKYNTALDFFIDIINNFTCFAVFFLQSFNLGNTKQKRGSLFFYQSL